MTTNAAGCNTDPNGTACCPPDEPTPSFLSYTFFDCQCPIFNGVKGGLAVSRGVFTTWPGPVTFPLIALPGDYLQLYCDPSLGWTLVAVIGGGNHVCTRISYTCSKFNVVFRVRLNRFVIPTPTCDVTQRDTYVRFEG